MSPRGGYRKGSGRKKHDDPGGQIAFWTKNKTRKLFTRAAKSAAKRASKEAGHPVTITRSKWLDDVAIAAAVEELGMK